MTLTLKEQFLLYVVLIAALSVLAATPYPADSPTLAEIEAEHGPRAVRWIFYAGAALILSPLVVCVVPVSRRLDRLTAPLEARLRARARDRR